MFNKILLLIISFCIILITGCSSLNTSTNKISPELKRDAVYLVKIMDANANKIQDLDNRDHQDFDSFMIKYQDLRKQAQDEKYLELNGIKKDLPESVVLLQQLDDLKSALSQIEIYKDDNKSLARAKDMYNNISNETRKTLEMDKF